MYTSYWFCFSSDIQTDRYTSYIANSLKYVLRPLLNQGKDKTFLYNQLGVVGLFYSHSQVTNVFSETDEIVGCCMEHTRDAWQTPPFHKFLRRRNVI